MSSLTPEEETSVRELIHKEGLSGVKDIPPRPTPEDIVENERIRKQEQDRINEQQNKPNLIRDLMDIPYQERTVEEYSALSFDELVVYHNNMVQKQTIIQEIIKLRELEETQSVWDFIGQSTFDELQTELKQLKENTRR